ncbi:MAG: TonB-dependent receptor [Myxococcota bacterium]
MSMIRAVAQAVALCGGLAGVIRGAHASTERDAKFEPQPELQDYVAVTTKWTEPVQQTPASVVVIGAEQIQRAGYRSVGEALTAAPGLFVSYDLQNYHVGIRGLFGGARSGSRYIKVMVDGVPVSFVQSGTYFLGPELIPIATVERIEVLRGPASSLYGAGALAGAINIVTRRAPYEGKTTTSGGLSAQAGALAETAFGGDAHVAMVSDTTYVLAAIGGSREDRSGLALPSSSPLASSYIDASGAPTRSSGDLSRPRVAFAKVERRLLGGRSGAMFLGRQYDSMAEFHDLTVLSHDTRVALTHWTASAYYERPFASGLGILVKGGAASGGPRQDDTFDLSSANSFTVQRDFGYREYTGSAELRYELANGGNILVGGDVSYDDERFQQYFEINRDTGVETPRPAPTARQLSNLGAYSQLLYPFTAWGTLAAGVRYDQHSVYGGAVAGRLATVVRPSERLSLKLLAGRSYKAPSPEQLYGVPIGPFDIQGRDNIAPQFMDGLEAVVDYFPATWLNVTTSVFYNRYSGALAYLARGTQLLPTEFDASSVGGELHLHGVASPTERVRLESTASISTQYTRTSQTEIGGFIEKDVPDNEAFPTVMGHGQVSARIEPLWLHAFAEYHWVGERVPTQSNLRLDGTADMGDPSYVLPAYQRVDLAVSSLPIDLGDARSIVGTVRLSNVLDARYSEIGFNGVDVPTLGRTLWVQLGLQM